MKWHRFRIIRQELGVSCLQAILSDLLICLPLHLQYKKQFRFFVECSNTAIIVFHFFQIFHYQSVAYPTTVGKFKDRISWVGNVAKGDASIAIQSPVMSDNGTFICSVKNPPDVYHNIPQTVLIVTERGKPPFHSALTCVIQLHCSFIRTLKIRALHRKLIPWISM